MTKSKKRCKITATAKSCLESLTEKQLADWLVRQPGKRSKALSGTTDYVRDLPPPPAPMTADYYRCIQSWMACHQLATEMNSLLEWINTLEIGIAALENATPGNPWIDWMRQELAETIKELAEKELVLDALVTAYQNCMTGTPV